MRVLITYESMYGNTHEVAESIAAGALVNSESTVLPFEQVTTEMVRDADIVVVGGPTHVHGMSSVRTRAAAIDAASSDSTLSLDDSVHEGDGLREWLEHLPEGRGKPAAAFDTRFDGPAIFTGRASRSIAKRLSDHGFDVVADPTSFLVDRHNRLVEGESDRAVAWGTLLVTPLRDVD